MDDLPSSPIAFGAFQGWGEPTKVLEHTQWKNAAGCGLNPKQIGSVDDQMVKIEYLPSEYPADASDTVLSGDVRLNRLKGKEEQNPKTNTPKPPKCVVDKVVMLSKLSST